ncbi:PKD domain protein [uncultured archaeon]|nr:PKD domain protein [uncultured archaeon]
MVKYFSLCLAILLFGICIGKCEEVCYIFGENSDSIVNDSRIISVNDTDMIPFTTAGVGGVTYNPNMTYKAIKELFIQKIEPGKVHQKTVDVLKSSGSRTIDQACDIYSYLTKHWTYVEGAKNETYDSLFNASTILAMNNKGDCNDFAILMASMLESIAGTTRIVLARGPVSSHAYAEVYLGNMVTDKTRVTQIINWLKEKYNKNEITTTRNLSSGDVWLNLDWGRNNFAVADCPGGSPPFPAKERIIVYTYKPPMTTLNPTPLSIFSSRPYGRKNVSENIEFDANRSNEVDTITNYNWDFGDKSHKEGKICVVNHTYLQGGNYTVSLIVTDERDQKNMSSLIIDVRGDQTQSKPIIESFSANPEVITPGASSNLIWATKGASSVTLSPGIGNVELNGNLRVSPNITTTYLLRSSNLNDSDEKTVRVLVRQMQPQPEKPEGILSYSPKEPMEGDVITFDASQSVDRDSNIIYYEWNFGDGNISTNKICQHVYNRYGRYIVVLTVIDESGQRNYTLKQIEVRPSAELSVDSFTFTPNPVCAGKTTTMAWTTSHAMGVTITPGIGSLEPSGSMVISPIQGMGYTIQAWNSSAHTKPKTVFLGVQQCMIDEPDQATNPSQDTGPYASSQTRAIEGCVKYLGGNIVRIGVDVVLKEVFNGNVFYIGSATTSRASGTFRIVYSIDRLQNPFNPYLIIQAFSGGKPFTDPVENVWNQDRVELLCMPTPR